MQKPTVVLLALALGTLAATPSLAQVSTGAALPALIAPPPAEQQVKVFDSAEIERIVSPIALYPDPLLAQVLTASTFAGEIPTAIKWVEARRGLSAEQMASALASEQVNWDPSVQALVAFPTVLQMMATTMPWTEEIGQAFKLQHGDVMDAVQKLRAQAQRYGYLRSSSDIEVVQSPAIEIRPVDPAYVIVPYYNPVVVFAPPRPRFVISTGIYLGFGVHLGAWYEPYGWRSTGFYWPSHRVVVAYPRWSDYDYTRRYGTYYARPEPRYAYPRQEVRYTQPVVRYDYDRGRSSRDAQVRVEPSRPRYEPSNNDDRRGRDQRAEQPRLQQPRNDPPREAQPRTARPRVEAVRPEQGRAEQGRSDQGRSAQTGSGSRDGGSRRRQ